MAAIDPSELTVSELREEIEDLNDPEELRAIRDVEADGDDRKSAKEAIERRITQCESETGEESNGDDGESTATDDDTDGESVTEELGEQLEDFEDADEESSTVESTEASEEGPATGSDDEDGTTDTMSEAETPQNESAAEGESTDETDTSSEGDASLIDVRDTVLNTAADLIGRRLDGISGIQRTDEGWSAIVNVIERRSVPDTQDILGRYEMTLDSNGEIVGYHRLNRYRRGDTTQEEWE